MGPPCRNLQAFVLPAPCTANTVRPCSRESGGEDEEEEGEEGEEGRSEGEEERGAGRTKRRGGGGRDVSGEKGDEEEAAAKVLVTSTV